MAPQIFISYSHTDSEFANSLCKEIEAAGYDVWLDRTDIKTGSHWDDEIVKGLNASQVFLILLSNKSVSSQNVKDEIGYAIDHNMQILPILLEVCDLPIRLKRYQYVDIVHLNQKEKIKTTLQQIQALIPWKASETSHPKKERKIMDPITLAAAVTALLSPFIKKAGEAAAEKLGEKLPEGLGKIWKVISKKSSNVKEAVDELGKNPDDPDNEVFFKKNLQKELEKDPEFAGMLAELLESAKKEQSIHIGGDGVVANNNSNAVGKIEVGGDLTGNITIGNSNSVNSND